MCVQIIVYNCRTQQHRTVLIIYPPNLQTIITVHHSLVEGRRGSERASLLRFLTPDEISPIAPTLL